MVIYTSTLLRRPTWIQKTLRAILSAAPFIVTIWMVETGLFLRKASVTRKDSLLLRVPMRCGRWLTEPTIFDFHSTEAGKKASLTITESVSRAISMIIRRTH